MDLRGAKGIVITGGAFTKTTKINRRNTFDVAVQTLYSKMLLEALHDFTDRHFPGEATPEAIDAVGRVISCPPGPGVVLVTSRDADQNSWIAHEVSTIHQASGTLAASFFCRPIDNDIDLDAWWGEVTKKFVPTLAYQFVTTYPKDRGSKDIQKLVRADPSILDRSNQLDLVIIKPLSLPSASKPLTVVCDGLDNGTPEQLQHCISAMLGIPGLRIVITRQSTTAQWIENDLNNRNIPFIEIPFLDSNERPSGRNSNQSKTLPRRLINFGMAVTDTALSCFRHVPLLGR